jgi:hypothetical protein
VQEKKVPWSVHLVRRHRDGEQFLVVARAHARLFAFGFALGVRLKELLGVPKLALLRAVDVFAVEARRWGRAHDNLADAVLLARLDDVHRALEVDLVVHLQRVVRAHERGDVPHAIRPLARAIDIRGVGQVALHPDDAFVVARVRGLRRDVERHDALGAALHQHLHQPAPDEAHPAGHHAPLGHRGKSR